MPGSVPCAPATGALVALVCRLPADSTTSCSQSRPLIGSSCICRGSMVVAIRDWLVSSSGAAPVTVTDSSTAETASFRGRSRLCPTDSSTPSCLTVVKPASSAVIRYTPVRIAPMRYPPSPSLTLRNVLPESMCSAVTVAPGRTAFVASVTMPERVTSCAAAGSGPASAAAKITARFHCVKAIAPSSHRLTRVWDKPERLLPSRRACTAVALLSCGGGWWIGATRRVNQP